MGQIRFEDDYMFRNNRMITSSPDIALTELVANAWDAGALHVNILSLYHHFYYPISKTKSHCM